MSFLANTCRYSHQEQKTSTWCQVYLAILSDIITFCLVVTLQNPKNTRSKFGSINYWIVFPLTNPLSAMGCTICSIPFKSYNSVIVHINDSIMPSKNSSAKFAQPTMGECSLEHTFMNYTLYSWID